VGISVGERRVELGHQDAVMRFLCGGQPCFEGPQCRIAGNRVVHGGALERRRFLRDVRQAPLRGEVDLALVAVQLAAQQREQARLARAGGADQADALAGLDGNVRGFEERLRAPAQRYVRKADHGAEKAAILQGTIQTMDRLRADPLRTFTEKAFRQVGVPAEDAKTIAALMLEADLQGSDGHGIFRLPQYIRRFQAGGANPRPKIRVERERAAMALVNGDNGMGHLAMSYAADLAIEKARAAGSAWVGVRWSNHAGPASLYARMPLREGMIGMYFAVGNANHLPPWGGVEMLLSTNPVAVAIPAGEEPPIVLDMATTVAAFGKVKTRAQRGETMPEGW